MALKQDQRLESSTEFYEEAIAEGEVDADKDLALGLVGEHAHTFDHADEVTVLRKIDLFFIPAMIIGERVLATYT